MNLHALLLAVALSTSSLPASATKVPQSGPRWSTWDAGLRTAASIQRPVLVDVTTDWCGWCRRMEKDVYARDDVRGYLAKHFVTVKINAESADAATYGDQHTTESALASHFRVTGYPTTVFLKANGEHLVNVPGYVPAEKFLLLLRYIGDGHLERGVTFEDFVAKSSARGTPK